jgi:hypothetical protein
MERYLKLNVTVVQKYSRGEDDLAIQFRAQARASAVESSAQKRWD